MSIAFIIKTITSLLPFYRYLLLFILTIVEGPLVTMIAGLLASWGLFNPFAAYATIICGEMVSDTLYYCLGSWGGVKISKRYLSFTKLNAPRLERFKKLFHRHPGKTLMIGKLTHAAGVPVLVSAGIAKVRFVTFFIFDILATFPKSFIFLLIGYYLGHSTQTVNDYLTYGTLIVTGTIILAFVVYLYIGKRLEEEIIE